MSKKTTKSSKGRKSTAKYKDIEKLKSQFDQCETYFDEGFGKFSKLHDEFIRLIDTNTYKLRKVAEIDSDELQVRKVFREVGKSFSGVEEKYRDLKQDTIFNMSNRFDQYDEMMTHMSLFCHGHEKFKFSERLYLPEMNGEQVRMPSPDPDDDEVKRWARRMRKLLEEWSKEYRIMDFELDLAKDVQAVFDNSKIMHSYFDFKGEIEKFGDQPKDSNEASYKNIPSDDRSALPGYRQNVARKMYYKGNVAVTKSIETANENSLHALKAWVDDLRNLKTDIISFDEKTVRQPGDTKPRPAYDDYIETIFGYKTDGLTLHVMSYREKGKLYDKRNSSMDKKVGLVRQLLRILFILHGRKMYHLALHPNNILISEKNRVVLSNIGLAQFIVNNPYVNQHVNQYIKDFDLSKKQNFEKYDVFSAATIIKEFLSFNNPHAAKVLETDLAPFLAGVDKREGIEALYNKFNDRKFTNSLLGEVDDFWNTRIENNEKYKEDPYTLIHRIAYSRFMKEFIDYFDHEHHLDVVPFVNHNESEVRRIEPFYILKHVKDVPGHIYNRQTISFRILLNCIEAYSCKKSRRRFFVTREGYSLAYSLLKDVMFDKDHNPRDYWTILEKIKDLTLDKRYWFGIISDEKARRNVSRIQMNKGGVVSYIVYGPREQRGTWKIIYKFPKDSNFFAKNGTLKSRIHSSRDFSSQEFLNINQHIADDILRVCNEYCKSTLGDWSVPDEEQMKISFHTPGALCYLKESRTAYVRSNETPKDMMRRIKLEAKRAKDEENQKKEAEKSIQEVSERKGDPEDLSKIKVVDSNPNDISIN